MRGGSLQTAVNVVKMDSWKSSADFRYLDETSQFKLESDRIGAQKRGQVYSPKPWEALPYLAKEDMGKIHVRGFLHNHVAQNPDGSFSHPATLSTGEVIRRLGSIWRTHSKNSRETQISHQRLVFSLSKEFHDALVKAGRNPDMALRGIIERSMRSFQEKFHPGDSVGYCYGLHHDTDNLHAHVYIHPRTRGGEFVGMSEQLQRLAQRGAASRHKNQLRFIRENARRRADEILKEIVDPKEAAYLKQNSYSDRIFFVPRQSHFARAKNDFRPRTPADFQLEQKRSAVVALDKQIAAKRIECHEVIGVRNLAAILRLRQPKWMRLLEQGQNAKLLRELRELQAQRYRLWAKYREARRRLIPGPHATRTVPKRKKAEAPAPALKPSHLKPTIKPTVTVRPKPRKTRFHF